MPELPEVETIRRGLDFMAGARVASLQLNRRDIARETSYEPRELVGQRLDSLNRRGKYLLLQFGERFLVMHLGMSGRFYALPVEEACTEAHVHLQLTFDNGWQLLYKDPRRFGGAWFTCEPGPVLARLGPEPFDRSFSGAYLFRATRNRKVAIKTLLLNQAFVAGLGNIYADEALFAARIKPSRRADSLTAREARRLQQAIVDVLQAAIASCGTTFRDYRDGFNQSGQFQELVQVYGRTGEKCRHCSKGLERTVIGGRSTHYCPFCQK